MATRKSPLIRVANRTVDKQGTDEGAADEIQSLVARKKALAPLAGGKPKMSNPLDQAKRFGRRIIKKIGFGNPFKG